MNRKALTFLLIVFLATMSAGSLADQYHMQRQHADDDVIFKDGVDFVPSLCGWDGTIGGNGGYLTSMTLWNDALYVGTADEEGFNGVANGVVQIDPLTAAASSLSSLSIAPANVTSFTASSTAGADRLLILGRFGSVQFAGTEVPDSSAIVGWDGKDVSILPGSPFASNSDAASLSAIDWNASLAIGGMFLYSGKPLLSFWSGAKWQTFGDQFQVEQASITPAVNALAVFQGHLYFAGRFDGLQQDAGKGSSAISSRDVMGFDGTDFFAVGGGVGDPYSSRVNTLAVFDNGTGEALYLGGRFQLSADGTTLLDGVARWDGKTLQPVGGGFQGPYEQVQVLLVHDDGSGPALYAAGTFSESGGVPLNNLAKLVGDTWVDVAGGVDGQVNAMATLPGGLLAVAGQFDHVGSDANDTRVPARGLATLACPQSR